MCNSNNQRKKEALHFRVGAMGRVRGKVSGRKWMEKIERGKWCDSILIIKVFKRKNVLNF